MKKLTAKEIRFIENYLKNSGVVYFDVRLEMTDHVASELEQRMEKETSRGFYQEFKDYMRLHKKPLLKSTRRYLWQADRKVLKQVFRNLYQPKTLLATATIMSFHALFTPEIVPGDFFLFFYLLVVIGVWVVPHLLLGKKNFLSLNRLAILFFLFIYLGKWGMGEYSIFYLSNIWINSLLILINMAVIKTTFDLIQFYIKHYQVS